MPTIFSIIISFFLISPAFASPLTEREELTLSLNPLTQIDASLHRP
ncbi:conjugal transfer protein, partial [Klebsiella pneumoniae]|nr:conjugal transfer protein [Klebsiella pneumoniae]